MKTGSIAVVEPQMANLFHAAFNAALLHAVALSFPGISISFRAMPKHAVAVRGILEVHAPKIVKAVEWRGISQDSGPSIFGRLRHNARLLRTVLDAGERVLFCSISRMQLLQLKRMLRTGHDVRAVLHGDLERIATPPRERFAANLFTLENVLSRRHAGDLRYVLLGASIAAHLPVRFAEVMANAAVIDMPYNFPAPLPAPEGPIVFGVFGNTGDGRVLEQIASRVKAVVSGIEFLLVGYVSDADAVDRLRPWVSGLGTAPIGQDEFQHRANAVTYALWLSEPGTFTLRASGSFLDALAYGKPLVYTANAYIDPYYAQAPDIGVRCAALSDVPEAVIALAARHHGDAYQNMQTAILKVRERFTPESLAQRLSQALQWN